VRAGGARAGGHGPGLPGSAAPGRGFTLPRAARLRRSADFRRVQGGGQRIRGAHLLVVVGAGGSACPRFGLAVSRKVGGAVVRNRVKRWLREAIRHERGALAAPLDLVFIAHPSAAAAGAAVLRDEVRAAIQRARRRPAR
jgi:ribonuclease P protein component